MKILKLEFSNCNSYGNRVQVIDFSQDKSHLYLVSGQNGHGKTTIKDVMELGMYGKVSGKKLKDIPNRTNGSAWIRITLVTKGKLVVVESGLAPTFINLWVDGHPYDKANVRGPREYLVEELLEVPFHVFTNVISLSIDDFKSFLKMAADDKRKIIDKLLSFAIINDVKERLRFQLKNSKDNLDSLVHKIDAMQNNLTQSLKQLEALSEKMKDQSDEKMKDLNENLAKFNDVRNLHNTKKQEFYQEEKNIKEKVNSALKDVMSTKNIVGNLNERLKLYNNSKCITCGSDLHSDFHVTVQKDLTTSLEQSQTQLDQALQIYEDTKQLEKKMELDKRSLMDKESKIMQHINTIQANISHITSAKGDNEFKYVNNIIETNKQQILDLTQNRSKSEEDWNLYKEAEEILDLTKQLSIKNILPNFNKEIYNLLQEMHLDYTIEFDENFDAKISHRKDEISLGTLSRGEAKKMDFVVLVAMIKMMKFKYPSINMLFLDELFDGLDSDGIYAVLKIINKTTKDLGLNTFVISHVQQFPNESFDYKIMIEKKNDFSNLVVEKA